MNKPIRKFIFPIVLFTALGVLSAVVMRNHTQLLFSDADVYFYVIIGSVIVHNILGLCVLISGDWLASHYPIYNLEQSRMWWHYSLIAFILLFINYLTIVAMRYLSHMPSPFYINLESVIIIVYIWFVEMMIMSLLLFSRSVQYTISILKEKRKLEAESIEAKYNALQQQLNPHFLFNSLNALISEIEYDPAEAVTFTQHLSDIYRYVLKCQDLKLVTIREELDFVESYIFLHKVRLGDCLKFTVQLSDDELDYKVPPLTLQLFIENVIKHNYISVSHPMDILLYSDMEQGVISFQNCLRPKKSVAESGRGLANLSERYKLLNGKDITINKSDDTFTVSVPLLNENTVL